MSQPLISVITPAYNAGKYLEETIKSILAQSFSDFEFIIIDDCSTDNTWLIIQEYAKKDQRIRPYQNESNLGIAGNRNRGAGLANGKYIVWQDADDLSYPDRLKKQAEFMEANPEVAISGGGLEFFDDSGSKSIRKYALDDDSLRKTIFRFSPVAQPAAIIRKSCLDEVGGYDLAWPPAEDLDMSFRLGLKYKFANLPDVLIKYREHPNSATFSKLKTIEMNTIKIRKKYAGNASYKMSFLDRVYNALQFISIYIIPPKIKISIFNLIRNTR